VLEAKSIKKPAGMRVSGCFWMLKILEMVPERATNNTLKGSLNKVLSDFYF
jgi:hypothetical protein